MRVPKLLLLNMIMMTALSSCRQEETIQATISEISVDYQGDDILVSVSASAPWTALANYPSPTGYPFEEEIEKGWIHFDMLSGEKGTSQVIIHIDPSSNYSRNGWAIFKLAGSETLLSIPVKQQGKLDREMKDLLSPAGYQYFAQRIHHAFVEDQGTVYFEDLLKIKTLNISSNPVDFIEDLVYLENLEVLYCSSCGLTSFTAKLPKLKELNCFFNEITHLNPDLFPSLEVLNCSFNPLVSTEIFQKESLKQLTCAGLPVHEFKVGPNLVSLACEECALTSLDLSEAFSLSNLSCDENDLRELDLSKTKISGLSCKKNPLLSTLILPENQQLHSLSCDSCHLSGTLHISSPSIRSVFVDNNQFERIVFGDESELSTLSCRNNRITEIVLPKTKEDASFHVHCDNNLLKGLGPISTRSQWKACSFSGNPGENGVFSITVFEDGIESIYGIDIIRAQVQYDSNYTWQWQGQVVTVELTPIPR